MTTKTNTQPVTNPFAQATLLGRPVGRVVLAPIDAPRFSAFGEVVS